MSFLFNTGKQLQVITERKYTKWSVTKDQRFHFRFVLENQFIYRAVASEAHQEEKACRYTLSRKPLRCYNTNFAH